MAQNKTQEEVNEKIVLRYPTDIVEEPVIYMLVKKFDLKVNILRADINPRKEGRMVIEVFGTSDGYANAIEWLREIGLHIYSLQQQIIWNENRCTHCGACSVFCPTGALEIERTEMKVSFNERKCVACEHCLKVCPVKAVDTIKEEV